jgi:peptidoglycan/xylan/chitin deacetylase (PgdA/CDA1 family)
MIDFPTHFKKIIKGYKKNYREYYALINKFYPQFIFDQNTKTIKEEIPVFTLHSVNPQRFEEQLVFLASNGYSTLKADDFYACLSGDKHIEDKTMLLTFDDGWKNLYTVVYPLLKKYNYYAICFLIPNLIKENISGDDNLKNENGKIISGAIPDSNILCSWDQIKEMHDSGFIDFQSHSMNHYLIYTSDKIVDFVYPFFDSYAMNLDIPLIRSNGHENFNRIVELGTPIYEHDSRFSGRKRYFDDETLRKLCTDFVQLNGGKNFFRKLNWRKKLKCVVNDYLLKNNDVGAFENEKEMKDSIFEEFQNSKLLIEKKLNKKVEHFCYPWWVGSDMASDISREAGYKTNFWGVIPDRKSNRVGDDPYKIPRLLSEDYIFRLPGEGRKPLRKIISDKSFPLVGKIFN